jgi:hypothetical protein
MDLRRQPNVAGGYRSRLGALLPILVLGLTTGCVDLESFVTKTDCPPTGPVCQVVATWYNEVAFTPDPVHGGAMTPGLAGRVYLFGSDLKFPLQGDGAVVIELYDETAKPAPGQVPLPLEGWRFDSETLKRLMRRDMVGWGYTLFLPWGTYKPEINRIRLKVRYEPAKGTNPIFAESSALVLAGQRGENPALAGH